jgi:uncharacterized protein with von Willebrand factor type A (vWA) domain
VLTDFARKLRAAGVAVDTSRVITGARALAEFKPIGPAEIYWATRLTFCSCLSDVQAFDAAFLDWFGARPAVTDSPAARLAVTETPTAGDSGEQAARPGDADQASIPGREESLTGRDLATLSPAERAEISALVTLLAPGCKPRRSIRSQAGGSRRVDSSRTLRMMLRNGGEPGDLRYRRPAHKPGRLVLLVDVSESMADYGDALLRFAAAAVRAGPGTEVFSLGTRLTRITGELAVSDPEEAINAVGQAESDWGGGTLLGTTLRAFLRAWGGRAAVRSAVIVLFSDGWSGDDARLVSEQAGRLSRLARFLVWADPAAGAEGYVPRAPALVHSLPTIDALVPAGSFEALRALAESLPRAERGAVCWHPSEHPRVRA